MRFLALPALFATALLLLAQPAQPAQDAQPGPQAQPGRPAQPAGEAQPAVAAPASESKPASGARLAREGKIYLVNNGTHIPLSLINSVSTKNAIVGDRVYLESVFPILADGRIVIPPGSYVAGTITAIKRPGKVHGRGEFHLRFDSLTLPNGTTRDFRAHVTGLDGRASEELDHKEGTIRSEGNKSGDVRTVGEATAAGASIGALAGSINGTPGMGAAIGAGAGAAAALVGIMFTRGPDAVLAKGTTIEMILDREVSFDASEVDFSQSNFPRLSSGDGNGPLPSTKSRDQGLPGIGRRF